MYLLTLQSLGTAVQVNVQSPLYDEFAQLDFNEKLIIVHNEKRL